MQKDQKQTEALLRQGDKATLEAVYTRYKGAFMAYFKKRGAGHIDLEDVYQDCIIAMYQNFVLNQLHLKESGLKTYLIGIGKRKMAGLFKGPTLKVLEDPEKMVQEIETDFSKPTKEQELLAKGYNNLGEKCRQMLQLYYYRGLTDKEIVANTNYKDVNTIKSYRSRCLKKLKELVHG